MRPPKTAWLGAALGAISALCGVVLALLAQGAHLGSAGAVALAGATLVLGSGVASFVVLWQMAPEPKVVRVRVPEVEVSASNVPPEPSLELDDLPGLVLLLDTHEVMAHSPAVSEVLGACSGPLLPRLAGVTRAALEAGERPASWVWTGKGSVQIFDVSYQRGPLGLLVNLSPQSAREQLKAALLLSQQRLGLARDLVGRKERPERAIALAFQALGELRKDVQTGSPAAMERSLEKMRQVVSLEGLPSLLETFDGTPAQIVTAAEAALRELESMSLEWLPPNPGPAGQLRQALSQSWMGVSPPRVLWEGGQGLQPDAAVVALLAKVLPSLLGSAEARLAEGLDPEGLLWLSTEAGELTARTDGPGLDLDRHRALRGLPGASDQQLLEDMVSGTDPEPPIPELDAVCARAKREGWRLLMSPGEPCGPGQRRVVLRMKPEAAQQAA